MASEPKVGDVQNMSSARDIADVFAGPEIGWVTCNLKGACRLLAGLLGRQRSAAQEMREVLRECENALGFCPFCEGPETTGPLIHAPTCRLARLLKGSEGE